MYCIHSSPDTPGPLCSPLKQYEIGSGENTLTCQHATTDTHIETTVLTNMQAGNVSSRVGVKGEILTKNVVLKSLLCHRHDR